MSARIKHKCTVEYLTAFAEDKNNHFWDLNNINASQI